MPSIEKSLQVQTTTMDQTFDLEEISRLMEALEMPEGRIAAPELAELNSVLTIDYRSAAGLPAPEMSRHLADIANSGIDPRRRAWSKWRDAQDYRVKLQGFDCAEIAVHAAPYTRGAGLLLWGFSCDARVGDRGNFVIFLNTAHRPGAITATVAHELGHYVHKRITSEDCGAVTPLASSFATHLEDKCELFSDSLVALSAYGIESAQMTPSSQNEQPGWIDEVIQARDCIRPEYRIDFANNQLSPVWRIRYLAATIHFFKLRKALLETAGV
ncbi:MAG TPA: hypothetical protein VN867_00800 [Candidatus Binataceae bacterium]|nr:hypothetical protein [Candidatus Binataceae bacterium]